MNIANIFGLFILQYMHEMMVPIDRINFQNIEIQTKTKKKYFFADEILNFCQKRNGFFVVNTTTFSIEIHSG